MSVQRAADILFVIGIILFVLVTTVAALNHMTSREFEQISGLVWLSAGLIAAAFVLTLRNRL